MRIAFARWRSGGLFNRPSPRKRLLPKKKTSSGFGFVSGLADGASAMPAKWSRPVFSFGFYEGKISRALIVVRRLPTIATTARPRVSAAGRSPLAFGERAPANIVGLLSLLLAPNRCREPLPKRPVMQSHGSTLSFHREMA